MIVPTMIDIYPGSDKPFELVVTDLPSGVTVTSASLMIKASLSDDDADALYSSVGTVDNDQPFNQAKITFVIGKSWTGAQAPSPTPYYWAAKLAWSNGLDVTPDGAHGPVYIRQPGIVGNV